MKIVNQRHPMSRLVITSLVFLLFFSLNLSAQESDVANGEKLFKSVCAACHTLEKKLVGPALMGITEKREQDWLIAWIKDSPGMIKSGDKLAIQVFEENNKLPMIANPQLSDQDIIDILEYTKGAPEPKVVNPIAQEIDPGVETGKQLFKINCVACHKLEGKLIGPELLGIGEKRDVEWLKLWIRDYNALIASGDILAKEVADSNPAAMIPFPNLSDEDIENILKYLDVGDVKQVIASTSTAKDNEIFNNPGLNIWTTLGCTILAFLLLIFIVAATTNKVVAEGEEKEGSMLKALIFNPFLHFLTVIFLLLASAFFLFGWLMQIDVNEGYTPIQPIVFSHAVHSGDNKIDCQYCHSSAKNSKTSGIPSANVCMNCHKTISEHKGELFGDYTKEDLDNEIQKLYDAVGWDKENVAYKEGAVQTPIEWVRIHNLADFAYYNHSQHVTVAGLECQKCHGLVEEMHEMSQFSPLTMNWCITCHRETGVDLTENEYYKNIHDEMLLKYGENGVEGVTVSQMGGLECGKCHY